MKHIVTFTDEAARLVPYSQLLVTMANIESYRDYPKHRRYGRYERASRQASLLLRRNGHFHLWA